MKNILISIAVVAALLKPAIAGGPVVDLDQMNFTVQDLMMQAEETFEVPAAPIVTKAHASGNKNLIKIANSEKCTDEILNTNTTKSLSTAGGVLISAGYWVFKELIKCYVFTKIVNGIEKQLKKCKKVRVKDHWVPPVYAYPDSSSVVQQQHYNIHPGSNHLHKQITIAIPRNNRK